MTKRSRAAFPRVRSDNRKSKISPADQNRKWAGLFAIVVALTLCGARTEAQQPTKIPRIGFVVGQGSTKNPGPTVEALRQGLQALGYIEGKNILVEYRYAEGIEDRLPGLVVELV